MALPLTMVIIAAEIDLSVASVLALSSAVMAYLWNHGQPIETIIPICIVVGALCGAFNGVLVTRLGLPSLAVTIGTLALFRGLAYVVIGDQSVTDFPALWTDRAFGNFSGTFVPDTMVLFAMLAAAFAVVLHATPFGRSIFAIGANEEASVLLGAARQARQVDPVHAVGRGRRARRRRHLAAQLDGGGQRRPGLRAHRRSRPCCSAACRSSAAAARSPGVILALLLLGGIQKALLLSESISSYWIQIVTGTLLVGSVLGPQPCPSRRRSPAASLTSTPGGGSMKSSTSRVCCSPRSRCWRRSSSPLAARRRMRTPRRTAHATATPAAAATADPSAEIPQGLKTVSIPKQLGNPYEEFEHSGVDEALKELGGSNRISGPTDAGASSQIPIINAAIQQKPDAIIIAGNDPDAVAPSLKQAAAKGIKVVGMDSDVAPDARSVFVNQVTTELVGKNQVESIARQIGNKGEIAILSATANATNQNAWIKVMKDTLKDPKYKDIKLVKVAYGDDDDQKSFQETQGLIQAYPNLKGIISPTTVGVAAAARYLSTSPQKGKIKLTGLGFPNQMRKFVKDGTVEEFQLWVPKDVGYLAGQAAAALVAGRITGKEGEKFTAGRLGDYTIGAERRDRPRPADDVHGQEHRRLRLLSH